MSHSNCKVVTAQTLILQVDAGGTSKQTAAGVDIRKLEAEDDDAPMRLETVGRDLRLALAQARQVHAQALIQSQPEPQEPKKLGTRIQDILPISSAILVHGAQLVSVDLGVELLSLTSS